VTLTTPDQWDNYNSPQNDPVSDIKTGVLQVRIQTGGARRGKIIVVMHDLVWNAIQLKPTLLDKIIEGWKAGLVSAPGTLLGANPLGNAGELLARIAESRTAPAVDAMAHRLGLVKERTRFMGDAEMESHGMRQAYAGSGGGSRSPRGPRGTA
jgi:hypothetical protein